MPHSLVSRPRSWTLVAPNPPAQSIASFQPRQAPQFRGEDLDCGLAKATRPKLEPIFLVDEKLPVADDRESHEKKRHGRREWSKAGIVERGAVVRFVEPPQHQPSLLIGWNAPVAQNFGEEFLGAICRQIGEYDDDCLVGHVLAVDRLHAQEQ